MANAIKDIAVVTGGASGIGLGTVELLAERDIHVIAVDRDEYKLAKLENHERIHPLSGNVSSNDTWQEVIALAKTDLGQAPNMYVANAATVIVGTTLELSDDDWSTILETNLMGTVRGARALLPGMIAAGKGAMVMIGSIDGFMAEQGLAAYCASKGAIAQFSKALAVDHARQNIRVNCVCPGVTDTPLFRYHLSKSDEPEAVLAAGIKRIYCAIPDPDERVAGKSFAKLKEAGLEVEVGLCKAEARRLNAAYIKHRTQGLPLVLLKLAQTLDGRIAAKGGVPCMLGSCANLDIWSIFDTRDNGTSHSSSRSYHQGFNQFFSFCIGRKIILFVPSFYSFYCLQ